MRNFAGEIVLVGALALSGCQTDNAERPNSAPVANAGADVSQDADHAVNLDGSLSVDPDGDDIVFTWSLDSAPAGSSLLNADQVFSVNKSPTATTSFRPDRAGTYVVKLIVHDSHDYSKPDFAIITVTSGQDPVANAGADQQGAAGDIFTFDGSGSYDPLARPLTYDWAFASVPEGSSVVALDNAATVSPSFSADVGGKYVVALVVSNGLSSSATDLANVVVKGIDGPPVADAGPDLWTSDCATIALDGSGSYDPNGDDLTYKWKLKGKPSASVATDANIADISAETTTFWPDEAGEYDMTLTVFDGTTWSDVDHAKITASERDENSAPVIDAGADQSIDGGSVVCEEDGYVYACDECDPNVVNLGLDGFIVDSDGDPYTVKWKATSGTAVIKDDSVLSTTATLTGATPTEPGACEDNEYVFTLTVVDCTGETVTDTVTFTVNCCGTGPDTGAKK